MGKKGNSKTKKKTDSSEKIKNGKKKSKKERKSPRKPLHERLYKFGQYIFMFIAIPLLIGYISNLTLCFYEDNYKISLLSTYNETVSFEVEDEKHNTKYEITLFCSNVNKKGPVYLLVGDVNSFHLGFSSNLKNSIRTCSYSTVGKGLNKISRTLLDDKKKYSELEEEEKFLKHHLGPLENVVRYLNEREQQKINVIGHGFGSNFIYQLKDSELIDNLYLFNPIDVSQTEIIKLYQKITSYGLFFSISGAIRIFNNYLDLMKWFGISKSEYLALSTITEENWKIKKLFLSKQKHWEETNLFLNLFLNLNISVPLSVVKEENWVKVKFVYSREMFKGKEIVFPEGFENTRNVVLVDENHEKIINKIVEYL